jgi:hypothetical protein
MEERELFENYEHQVWEFTPRFYKIIGVSVVINSLMLLALGQFNIFTTRGCDTPYVGVVCKVLDSAYVASVFWGKGAEWESRPYTKTEIGDEDVVTVIDVGERLEYPEGYFYQEDEIAQVVPTDGYGNPTSIDPNNPTSTTSSNSGEDMLNKPAVTPTPNPKNQNQNIPDTPWGGSTAPVKGKTQKPNKGKPSNESPKNLDLDEGTVAKVKPTPSPTPTPDANKAKEEFNNKFNKAPFQTLADGVIAKVDSDKPEEKVDLKQSFTVVLDGTLTEEGKFDAKKTRFAKGEGDQKIVDVAKSAIEAIGDSKILSYLQALGVDKVNITLVQDDKQITAVIKSNQPTEEKARTVSSGFNGIIAVAKLNTRDDADVQALLKGVKFKSEGKSFVINFAMPKEEAHKLIDQKLQEARQKKSQTNNGNEAKNATGKSLR